MGRRIGSMCTGYSGLDAGVQAIFGGDVVWVSDNDPGCVKILEHRMPGVPNLGDIRTVDWVGVEPVHILCAGFPCQAVSGAGKQKGMADERWIWPYIPQAISRMGSRPALLVFENVPRLLTIDGGAAMAQVIYSLAEIGYVGRYGLYRASAAGACHKRERWFLLAYDIAAAHAADGRSQARQPESAPLARGHDADRRGAETGWIQRPGVTDPGPETGDLRLFRSPGANLGSNGGGQSAAKRLAGGHHPSIEDQVIDLVKLLPTPSASNFEHSSPEAFRARREKLKAKGYNGNGFGLTPSMAVQTAYQSQGQEISWQEYEPAVRRWESVHGPAPCPVEPGKYGNPRLAAAFAEWMMGLPAGWVTGVPGLARSAQLRAIGNGVVPHQAAMAIADLYGPLP